MTPNDIARVAHEVNRAYCLALGDSSHLAWDDASAWQRGSVIDGVRFHLENPGASPRAAHNAWFMEKQATGWGYGPVKDADLREHPCCVSYDELPTEQRAKGYLFAAVVSALAKHKGGD